MKKIKKNSKKYQNIEKNKHVFTFPLHIASVTKKNKIKTKKE